MVRAEEWVPAGIDTRRATEARVYDYMLGGVHHLDVDRRVGEQIIAAVPDVRLVCHASREFLRRVVEFLVDAGIRQFLDIGAGIPTVGHTHEVAQARAPESRVVFVDIDPLAVAHCRMILGWNDRTAVIEEDARHPERILEAVEAGGLLDLTQPVAVLMVVLLQYISDADDPGGIVSRFMRPLASGSYLALSDPTNDGSKDWTTTQEIARRGGFEVAMRSHRQMLAMFGDLELVAPGLVWIPQWRPTTVTDAFHDQPEASGYYAGLARKT